MALDTRALVRCVPLNAASLGLLAALAVAPMPTLSAQASDARTVFSSIQWVHGEKEVDIGNLAEFTVPHGCRYTDADGARTFLVLTENPPNGREQGLLFCGYIPGENGSEDATEGAGESTSASAT